MRLLRWLLGGLGVYFLLFASPTWGNEGVIQASSLRIRTGPGLRYPVRITLSKGTRLSILGRRGSWYKVRWGTIEGYAASKYIKVERIRGTVKTSSLRVRSGPGTNYAQIGVLPRGTKVEILNAKNGWYQIRLTPRMGDFGSVTRTTGWVSGRYINTRGIRVPEGRGNESLPRSPEGRGNESSPRSPESRTEESSSGRTGTHANPSAMSHTPIVRPPRPDELRRKWRELGVFKPTFYWIAFEEDYSGPKNTPVYDTRGKLIGYFPRKFVKHLRLEGTGVLKDGRVLTYVRRNRFAVVRKRAPFGLGSRNNPLQPFRSLAVDKKIIPLGSVLYIPAAKGIKLPDGTVHDGIFYADDVGGAIRGRRIDIFVAHEYWRKYFEKAGIKSFTKLKVYILKKGGAAFREGILRRLERVRRP